MGLVSDCCDVPSSALVVVQLPEHTGALMDRSTAIVPCKRERVSFDGV